MSAPPGTGALVLVPTYDERDNVRALLPEIRAALPGAGILVIDDASPDGTGEAVRALMPTMPGLELLARPGKQGLGRAYVDAFRRVLGSSAPPRVLITMDADGSHAAEHLPALLAASAGAELVVGSRYVAGGAIEAWEPWRYGLSRLGNLYARTLTGLPIRDLTAGFMAIDAGVLGRIDLDRIGASGYAFLMDLKFQLVHRGGARVREVPILFRARRGGESKLSGHIVREGLTTPLRLWAARWSAG